MGVVWRAPTSWRLVQAVNCTRINFGMNYLARVTKKDSKDHLRAPVSLEAENLWTSSCSTLRQRWPGTRGPKQWPRPWVASPDLSPTWKEPRGEEKEGGIPGAAEYKMSASKGEKEPQQAEQEYEVPKEQQNNNWNI